MKLNQVYEAKKYLKRSIELTKNELPYIALAKLCLFENHITEAQNAYTTALRYYIFIFYFNIFYDEHFILFHKHLARADLIPALRDYCLECSCLRCNTSEYYVLPLIANSNYRFQIKKIQS